MNTPGPHRTSHTEVTGSSVADTVRTAAENQMSFLPGDRVDLTAAEKRYREMVDKGLGRLGWFDGDDVITPTDPGIGTGSVAAHTITTSFSSALETIQDELFHRKFAVSSVRLNHFGIPVSDANTPPAERASDVPEGQTWVVEPYDYFDGDYYIGWAMAPGTPSRWEVWSPGQGTYRLRDVDLQLVRRLVMDPEEP